ncbi:hypothetical protein NQ318_004095 [Aromia moschata]|uniref:Transposase n=1 Tax=Aromia moschata TaxID=1265417 RepID=A0AAV8XSP8_9CUCU|nr:hypothetical protein NQ318_004095 [Aromia moschata]
MPGKRLNSQAREIVAKLLNYFMAEKENLGPLISVNAVQQRVADALGISLRTVCSIKTSPKIPEASTNIKYKPRLKSKTDDLPEGHKVEVRNVIYNIYAEKKHVTLRILKEELKVKCVLDANINTISKLLSNIGFKYKQDDNRRALMEKTNIALLRCEFLRKYMVNRNSNTSRQLVFLDETWIFAKGNQTKSWQDESKKSVRKPEGYEGKRFIVLHAGSNKGFVDNAG